MTFQNQNQFPPNNFDEKQRIDEEIKQADVALQSKNVSIEAINEHLKLSEELDKHGLSTNDIDKLLKLLVNAKKYGFDGKEIAEKLYSIQELEWKEKELKDKCKKLSKRISSYKDIVPFTESIVALGVGIEELIAPRCWSKANLLLIAAACSQISTKETMQRSLESNLNHILTTKHLSITVGG